MNLPSALAKIDELERHRLQLAGDNHTLTDDNHTLTDDNRTLTSDNRDLAHMVEDLGRKLERAVSALRGNRSEKLDPDGLLEGCFEFMTQEELDLLGYSPNAEEPAIEEEGEEEPKPRSRKKRKRASTAHLEQRQQAVPVPPEDRECPGCKESMPVVGSVVSEKWGYEPAVLYVMQYLLEKRACSCGEGIVVAKMPKLPIEKGKAQPDLLAHVIVAKYLDGLPYYRQSKILERSGFAISDKTMVEWNRQVADLLEPVLHIMLRQVLAEGYLQADETGLRQQMKGGCEKGWLWAYGRPRGQVYYDYQPNRSRDGPDQILGGFKGFLQADGYGAYKGIANESADIVLFACWAHTRRYFIEALPKSKMRAGKILKLIQKLYRIEKHSRAAGESSAQRQRRRQIDAPKLLDCIKSNLEAFQQEPTYLPKSKLGEAIGYTLRRWTELTRYVDHGEVEIDTNHIENGMRVIAIARKNFLFVGSEEGGHRAARLFSLIESCRRLGLNPQDYFTDVLTRIRSTPLEELEQLTPLGWKLAQAAATTPPQE